MFALTLQVMSYIWQNLFGSVNQSSPGRGKTTWGEKNVFSSLASTRTPNADGVGQQIMSWSAQVHRVTELHIFDYDVLVSFDSGGWCLVASWLGLAGDESSKQFIFLSLSKFPE